MKTAVLHAVWLASESKWVAMLEDQVLKDQPHFESREACVRWMNELLTEPTSH